MPKKRLDRKCTTLNEAMKIREEKGFVVEFIATEKGFLDPAKGKTYLPEAIATIEVIGIDSTLKESKASEILYLLTTVDGDQGWISDTYGLQANELLANHLKRRKEDIIHIQLPEEDADRNISFSLTDAAF